MTREFRGNGRRHSPQALFFVCLLVATGGIGCSKQPDRPPFTESADGRFGTSCEQELVPVPGTDRAEEGRVCRPPFVRLIARPEDYHGKIVGVMGTAEVVGDFVFLYPDEESLLRQDFGSAIVVRGDLSSIENRDPNKTLILDNVMVYGKFDAFRTIGRGKVPYLGILDLIASPAQVTLPKRIPRNGSSE